MHKLTLTLALMAPVALTSTACLNDACVKTAAARGAAGALVDDAQISLAQASAVVAQISNPDLRTKALAALAGAEASLRAAVHVLHGLEGACTAPDVKSIFKDFIAAWQALAPFLALLGGPSAGSQVQAPLVMSL